MPGENRKIRFWAVFAIGVGGMGGAAFTIELIYRAITGREIKPAPGPDGSPK